MDKIYAVRKGKVEVLEQNITLKDFREKFHREYEIFEDDGVTPLDENTLGYTLDNKDSGKPWFVSKKYFKNNYILYTETKGEKNG